jgi:phosphoribosylformylglycinamidine synthase
MLFRCEVNIRPRPDILDPQGDAVGKALANLGFTGLGAVKVGRYLILDMEAEGPEAARQQVEDMCRKLLANPITEDYELKVAAG